MNKKTRINKKNDWVERRFPETQRVGDERLPSEHDADRIVYTSPFRRLQSKTQVLGVGEGDFHRTRLTHSIEVAQLGMGIVRLLRRKHQSNPSIRFLLPQLPLITAVCLSHDLGHPPFGHGGEKALNLKMIGYGGFEANAQTLRILTRLERKSGKDGLNLTRRTLLGILKYPAPRSLVMKTNSRNPSTIGPPKCYFDSEEKIVQWILKPFSKDDRKRFRKIDKALQSKYGKPMGRSLDSSIMELADDIAYGVHDLEDVVALRLINSETFNSVDKSYNEKWAKKVGLPGKMERITPELFSGDRSRRREGISQIINALIISIEITENHSFSHPLLRYTATLSEAARLFLEALKELVYKRVVCSPEVKMSDFRGEHLIIKTFEAIESDPKSLLKENFRDLYEASGSKAEQMRVIADFVSGMTDEYASRFYERLFVPHQGTIFQRL